MSGFKNILLNPASISLDASARLRVSQITTLHDGKILNSDNVFIFDNQGTGTSAFTANKYNMSVTSGQFFVRQTKRFYPYSSGKSQLIECTFDNFQIESNVNKRVGYFSSSAISPYSATTDGFYLENDGNTFRLKADRAGTNTINVPWTSWVNYSLVSSYDWSKFTVIVFDFIWLGGAVLRLFLKTNLGFVLVHTVNYAGSSTNTFIQSPNQPIRYEIRSTTGSGSLRYICSQVGTEGSINECGYNNSVKSLSNAAIISNTCATVGTVYPLKAIRKKTTHRDNAVKITDAQVFVNSNDQAIWSIQLNPIFTSGLTYTDVSNSGIQEANGSDVAVISISGLTNGRILASGIITQNGMMPSNLFKDDFLSYLGCSLNNTMDEIVLCIQPITANVTVNGIINLKEY